MESAGHKDYLRVGKVKLVYYMVRVWCIVNSSIVLFDYDVSCVYLNFQTWNFSFCDWYWPGYPYWAGWSELGLRDLHWCNLGQNAPSQRRAGVASTSQCQQKFFQIQHWIDDFAFVTAQGAWVTSDRCSEWILEWRFWRHLPWAGMGRGEVG